MPNAPVARRQKRGPTARKPRRSQAPGVWFYDPREVLARFREDHSNVASAPPTDVPDEYRGSGRALTWEDE